MKIDKQLAKWFKVEVLDRRTKDGWFFGRRYYVTVKFQDGQILEWSTGPKTYYSFEIGKKLEIKLYNHEDGNWYPYPE